MFTNKLITKDLISSASDWSDGTNTLLSLVEIDNNNLSNTDNEVKLKYLINIQQSVNYEPKTMKIE